MRSIYYKEENEVPIDDAWDSQSETLLHGWQNSFEFFFFFIFCTFRPFDWHEFCNMPGRKRT